MSRNRRKSSTRSSRASGARSSGPTEPLAAMVLQDREIVDVGREIGAYKHAKMAGAVALFILRRGLTALARHYRLISPS